LGLAPGRGRKIRGQVKNAKSWRFEKVAN